MHQFMRITRERERKLRDYSFPVEFSFLTTRDSFLSRTYISLSRFFSHPLVFSSLSCYKEGEKEERKGKLLVRTGAKWISRRARRSREMIATRFPPMKFWTNFSGLLG